MASKKGTKTFNHDFGWALKMLKQGKRVSRTGWNGKGMCVAFFEGHKEGIPADTNTANTWGLTEGECFRLEPYMQLRMVNGSHSMWVPSINDCLSNDWGLSE